MSDSPFAASGDPLLGAAFGNYQVVRRIGEGGMGTVYELLHPGIGKRLALKLLHPEYAARPEIVRRFFDEARAVNLVGHPNIVDIIDYGTREDGSSYLTMEYLEGESLAALIKRQGRLTPDEARPLLLPICSALTAAHAAGITHRDLKPENLHLVPRPDHPRYVKVLDFGIAKLEGDLLVDAGVRTRSGMVMGTPRYMSPEQGMGRSGEIDHRTDVYALGVIIFEMLTGHVPFTADSFGDLVLKHLQEPPPWPSALHPDIPLAWSQLILRSLAKRREDRFQSMAQLAQAIEAAVVPAAAAVTVAPPAAGPGFGSKSGVSGRYRVGERLGGGGMAEVFRATLMGIEGFARAVAVKRMLPALSEDPGFSEMFVNEARIASRMAHPNIVSVLDFDRDADKRLLIIMELVDGKDLRQLVAAGPLPVGVSAFVIAEVLRALTYAHELSENGQPLGVVHRDVSPHNVLLSWQGSVKLGDFGIAKAVAASNASNSGSLRGKVGYMSPEQAHGLDLDGRSDLFAVGIMLHELLTGARLFHGSTEAEVLARMLTQPIVTPRALRDDVPGDLEAVAMGLLARDRDRRFPSARAALDALLHCAAMTARGELELAALLAARFPAEVSLPPDAGSPVRRASASTRALGRPLPAVGQTGTMPPDGAAASGRGAVLRWGIVLVALAGAAAALAITWRGCDDRPEGAPRQAAAMIDAAPAPAPPPVAVGAVEVPPPPPAESVPPAGPADAGAPVPAHPREPGRRPVRPPVAPPAEAPADATPGLLDLVVTPWADVKVDGVPRGSTPLKLQLAPGKHRIDIRNDEFGEHETFTVTIKAGQTTAKTINWKD